MLGGAGRPICACGAGAAGGAKPATGCCWNIRIQSGVCACSSGAALAVLAVAPWLVLRTFASTALRAPVLSRWKRGGQACPAGGGGVRSRRDGSSSGASTWSRAASITSWSTLGAGWYRGALFWSAVRPGSLISTSGSTDCTGSATRPGSLNSVCCSTGCARSCAFCRRHLPVMEQAAVSSASEGHLALAGSPTCSIDGLQLGSSLRGGGASSCGGPLQAGVHGRATCV